MTSTVKRIATQEEQAQREQEQRERDRETISLPGLMRIDEVVAEELRWVWYPYIPAGKLTMLEGDPGLGKSWISCDIAARLSTGTPFPGSDQSRPPEKVLMLSAEDGLGETIKPRLTALGANTHNIVASDAHFTLDDTGMRRMEATMSRVGATIVFMDPIVAYMGAGIDMHRANEVRGLMSSLHQVAKRTGSAIIAVRHLRKAGGQNAIYRGIGSIDFTAAARSALQVGVTKTGRHFMEHIKHNLSPAGPTLGYEVTDGRFQWTGAMNWEVDDKKTSTKRRGVDVAGFLHDVLKDGPRPAKEVFEAAKRYFISPTTLAKEKGGIAFSRKVGKEWVWELSSREGMGDLVLPSPSPQGPKVDPLLQEALDRFRGTQNG